MHGKRWWASKTVWANLVAGLATLATVFGVDLGLSAEVQAEIVAAVMVVANLALRFVTEEPIVR